MKARIQKLLEIIDDLTLENLSSGLKSLQHIGGFTSFNSWASNVGFLIDAYNKLTPEQKAQFDWWRVAATLEGFELLLMISFVYATRRAIKQ
jgi:hypothetical protein